MSAAAELTRLANRLRLERALGHLAWGVGGGIAAAGVMHGVVPIGVGLGMSAAVALAADRFRRIRARDIAEHLDRVVPELEESGTLLLAEPGSLAPLAELQRARIAERWTRLDIPAALPHRELRRGLMAGAALALLGLVLYRWLPAPVGPGQAAAVAESGASLSIAALDAEVTPPAYTHTSRFGLRGQDGEVPEGSELRWLAEVRGPATAVWLAGSAGDSVPFEHEGGIRWRATLRATRSALWRLRAIGADTLRAESADLRLAVRPDRPPAITVLKPEERTQFAPNAIAPLPVEALATDDYGIDSTAIAVTIASGRGEAVRFRRLRLPFTSRTSEPGRGLHLRATLDLPGLHLGPGDELYFVAEATDSRRPVPNRSRSGTIFITIADTATAPTADLAKMAMGVQPEYFRSERQIIIDTEKLLADQSRISVAEFRQRANDLGIDQGLLRLRYGQFLGEEFEEESSDIGKVHEHDSAENATLLGQGVKDLLRAALSAMWQAELQLRIAEPRAALPFEHRALEMIKQVQQEARVYVQRVGFDPPPIEVAKLRLTGKLEGLAGQARSSTSAPHDSLPAIREALRLLGGVTVAPIELRGALERAGNEVAALAVADPVYLGAVRDLRRLIDALASGKGCDDCRAAVERGLYAALPPAAPLPAHEARARSAVAARFRALLGGAP